ncbi:MAG TPA: acylphosphatase [Gammaproteobacteria bacterium]|nr:acylphosphatase [Gammaproteobacteria bacterium]
MQTGCMRCVVHGRVQGVFFRASTRDVAGKLGLSGGVSNLPDGGVEVIACGEARALEELRRWLRKGPPLARVESLQCEELPGLPSHYRPDFTF